MVLVFALALVLGEDTARVHNLELRDAYRVAEQRSPRLAGARALARAIEAQAASARRPPDPQLQIGVMNYALPDWRPMETVGMTQLQLMQVLPVGGKLGLAGRVATARSAVAFEDAREVHWALRAQVAMVFYDLYATDQALEVARRTLRLLQDIRATAEAMYRAGQGRQADVLRAQVEIARMTQDTVRMTTMRTGMAARLNALLDRAADSLVGSPVLPVFPDSSPHLDALLEMSQRDRAMVRAAERELEAANAQQTLMHRAIWPDITVGVQLGQRGGTMGTVRMGSVMLGASLPVFASNRQLKMREEGSAMRLMAAAEVAEVRAQTRGQVISAYAALTRARSLATLYRRTIIPQAEAAAASALAAYRVGGVDFMTLLDDRMTVNSYKQELFTLQAEEGKAWAELEMLLGRELVGVRGAQ